MRQEGPGGAGRSGRARAAEAAAPARAAGLHGGTAVDERPGSAAAAAELGDATVRGGGEGRGKTGFLGTSLHRGVLTSGSADQLAALTARAAAAPSACVQFVDGNRLRLYGS